jgi:hypothetical protein
VFAEWLRELFPRTAETTHTLGVMEWAGSPGQSPARELRKQKQGHSGTRKIRHVCLACNTGWLSINIEQISKPVLIPLLRGEATQINPAIQRILAIWAAKTVMTAEYIHPSKVVIHQAERTWLKENLIPPAGWNVWIGTYQGLEWGELAIQQHAAKLRLPAVDNGNPSEHNLIFTILGMRRLMFVVVSSTDPNVCGIMDSVGSPNVACLSRIWPIVQENILWPRSAVLTDADADQMAGTYLTQVLIQIAMQRG